MVRFMILREMAGFYCSKLAAVKIDRLLDLHVTLEYGKHKNMMDVEVVKDEAVDVVIIDRSGKGFAFVTQMTGTAFVSIV